MPYMKQDMALGSMFRHTFLGNYKEHLWFVLTPPHAGNQVVVSMTTWKPTKDNDETVLLHPDPQYPWIQHKSYVAYFAARLESKDTLRMFKLLSIVDTKLVDKMRKGVHDSLYSPQFVIDFLVKWGY